MFERKIETVEEFENQIKLLARIMSFGYFIIIATFPLFVGASLIIKDFFLWIYFILFLAFSGLVSLFQYQVMKLKFNFWSDISIFEPLFLIIFYMILGALFALILLLFILISIIGTIALTSWPIYLGGAVMFLFYIPVFYVVLRYRRKKFKGERIKYFRGKKTEIEEYVKKALGSLNLKYEFVKEGSKWTMMVPTYKIQGFDISVKVNQFKAKEVQVATKVQDLEDIPKAKEIERAIDSYLNILAT